MPCHAILNQRAQVAGSVPALLAHPALLDALAQGVARLFGEPVAVSSAQAGPTYWDHVYYAYLRTHRIAQPWPTGQVDTRAGIDIGGTRGCLRLEPAGTVHMRGGYEPSRYYTPAEAARLLPQAQALVEQFSVLAVQALIAQRLRSLGTIESITAHQGATTITLNVNL